LKPPALAILVLAVAAACGRAPSGVGSSPTELTVLAAASLRGALEDIGPAYAEAQPRIRLTVSTASSAALRAQIEQGAPADVFLSADTEQPAALADAGLGAGDPRVFTASRLAIIVPSGDAAAIDTPADLARPGVRIVAAGQAVPITRYAGELVTKLAALDGYPAGFAEAYAANVVSREDDVKAVVSKVALGEGDAAIVYATDALASDAVATVDIPPEANVTASYAAIVVATSAHPDEAAAFIDWLVGAEGKAILAALGFSPPS